MRFRDVGVQLEYDGDFKIYREDGISRYGKPDEHVQKAWEVLIRSVVLCLISSRFMLSRHP